MSEILAQEHECLQGDAIERLRPPGHLCSSNASEGEQFASVVPFLPIGLERGEKCVYVSDDDRRLEAVRAVHRASGVDVDQAIKSDALFWSPRIGLIFGTTNSSPGRAFLFYGPQSSRVDRS